MVLTIGLTGCSGFLGGNVLRGLLSRGYKVRGTVRNLKDETKVAHLKNIHENAEENLELFEGDNTIQNSYDQCFQGCNFVLHTASPFFMEAQDPQKQLVDPAVNGTIYALESAAKAKVKRVVLTSSLAAVIGFQRDEDPNYTATEQDWNEKSSLVLDPYQFSKTEAEKAAWKKSKELDLDLVVINPSGIFGPVNSSRGDSTSTNIIIGALKGAFKDNPPTITFGTIDVRDVAESHILAFEKENANGRYLCTSEDAVDVVSLSETIEKLYPNQYPDLPKKRISDKLPTATYANNQKIRNDLGIQFKTREDTIKDMIESLKEFKLV